MSLVDCIIPNVGILTGVFITVVQSSVSVCLHLVLQKRFLCPFKPWTPKPKQTKMETQYLTPKYL